MSTPPGAINAYGARRRGGCQVAQLDLQRYVVEVLESLKIPYFITGSVATIFFGEPRLTTKGAQINT